MRSATFAFAVWACLLPSFGNAACGDMNGPGYRNSKGDCVGWADLARVCGDPPSQCCTLEKTHPNAAEAAAFGAKIREFMEQAGARIHRRARSC